MIEGKYGVQWTDEQKRKGTIYGAWALGILVLFLALGALFHST